MNRIVAGKNNVDVVQRLHLVIFQKEILSSSLLVDILNRIGFVNTRPEIIRITTECNAKQFQESIHTVEQGLWCVCCGIHRWSTFKYNDTICQISSHDEIVLDHETSFFGVQNISAGKE